MKGRYGYPEKLLKTLKEEAPLLLFARGNIKLLAEKAVGFVAPAMRPKKVSLWLENVQRSLRDGEINVISGYAFHGVDPGSA